MAQPDATGIPIEEGSGNRPPDPPKYAFDSGRVLTTAQAHGMAVEFDLFHEGYGWVYCPTCGWGKGADREARQHWTLDLSFYARWPWGCDVCRATELRPRD